MATHKSLRRSFAPVAMATSVLAFGFLAITGVGVNGAGASPASKTIAIAKGNQRFHLTWGASTAGSSLSGALGKFRISAKITQPDPNATKYVLQGQLSGFTLHVVLAESVSTTTVTLTADGSVGNRPLKATGTIRTSSTGSWVVTLNGKIGADKISGRFPLSAFTATGVSGVINVS